MNASGGFICYMLSKIFCSDLVHTKLKEKLDGLNKTVSKSVSFKFLQIDEHKDNLFFYLTFLRVFPGSPNWLMNLTFAHIEAIKPYQVYFSIFIGLMPWNFVTCEGGQILSTIKSKSDVIKPETYVRLAIIAGACLLPPLIKKYMTKAVDSEDKKIKAA